MTSRDIEDVKRSRPLYKWKKGALKKKVQKIVQAGSCQIPSNLPFFTSDDIKENWRGSFVVSSKNNPARVFQRERQTRIFKVSRKNVSIKSVPWKVFKFRHFVSKKTFKQLGFARLAANSFAAILTTGTTLWLDNLSLKHSFKNTVAFTLKTTKNLDENRVNRRSALQAFRTQASQFV